jgi:hypothetical protein
MLGRLSFTKSGSKSNLSDRATPSPSLESNWTTNSAGDLQLSNIRVYYNESDGCTDIQLDNGAAHGIIFVCKSVAASEFPKHQYGRQFSVVSHVVEHPNGVNAKILSTLSPGDLLVAINGRSVLQDEHSDVMDLLQMLRIGTLPIRLKFLLASKHSSFSQCVNKYEEWTQSQAKSSQTDIYGFGRSVEYLQGERAQLSAAAELTAWRDRDWVEYLKSIGVSVKCDVCPRRATHC